MVRLLEQLIATPSVSRGEEESARVLLRWLDARGVEPRRLHNNVYAVAPDYRPGRPTLLLNSHHDTVKPSPAYTRDPFTPVVEGCRLYGLGSNDAGASAVSLAEVFCRLRTKLLPFNLVLALTAEEEVSGENGVRALLPHLADEGIHIDMGIVGEPTGMQPAIAERGLIVLDCEAHGVAGHAARNEGVNALYKALDDIAALRSIQFDRESAVLGPVKVSVTMIEAGRQHNVVPESCRFVVDVRTTDAYTNEETEAYIAARVKAVVKARSYRLRASVLDAAHPLAKAAVAVGGKPFVSPTMSDMALMPFPTLKIGPGDSARSHTADEYILLSELEQAVPAYIKLIENIKK